jgi:hypothetical protein
MKLPQHHYLVDQLLPFGLFLLAGNPKIGKSWFVLQLGIAVSNGTEFLGFKTNQSHVLYFCLEDTYQRIQERLIDYEDEPLDNIKFSREAKKLNKGLTQSLMSYLKQHPDTKLIIIDTLQKIRTSKIDGYTYGQDYKEINILNDFVNKTEVSILLVHHLRKMKAENPFEEISGTTGISGAVDGMYVMKKVHESSDDIKLIASGRDIINFDLTIHFNKDTHHYELLKKSLEDVVEDEITLKVIEIIKELKFFEGTATELLLVLNSYFNVDISASEFSKRIKRNRKLFKEHNIEYLFSRTGSKRTISLREISGSSDSNDANDG